MKQRLYVAVAADGLFKFGRSRNPKQRIRQLRRRGPLRLVAVTQPLDAAAEIERTAQRLLTLLGKQVAGEWFRCSRGDIDRAITQAREIVGGGQLALHEGGDVTLPRKSEFSTAFSGEMNEVLQIRCTDDVMTGLDELRREHPDIPTRAGMARILIEASIEKHRAKKAREAGR